LATDKLLLTTTVLQLRRRHPEAFLGGAYLPLASTTAHAWGFARGDAAATIVTRLPRHRHADDNPEQLAGGQDPRGPHRRRAADNTQLPAPTSGRPGNATTDLPDGQPDNATADLPDGWPDNAVVALPDGGWQNLLTGSHHTGEFRLGTDLGGWPCALLERVG
ncbi:MAG: hypothetical protein VB036_06170, partial [Propionicimonas sp.]|nr:hypothetical protein [Propionicimonas sp.]